MRRSEQNKADVVEDHRGRGVPRIELTESPEDFKGAPKGKRDRAGQLAEIRYGKHAT